MAISHLCLSCGLDLARQRALLDPIHHLPIVTCPKCGWSSVRRRHPLITHWRKWRHAEIAVSVMILQILLATMLVLVIVLVSQNAAEQMNLNHESLRATLAWALSIDQPPNRNALYDFGPIDAGFWIGMSMLAGVWLGSCFPHWKWWTLFLAWSVLLITATNMGVLFWVLFKPIAMLADSPAPYPGPSLSQWTLQLRVVGASVLISLGCIPLGLPVQRFWRGASIRRWKKLLTSVRRTRRQS